MATLEKLRKRSGLLLAIVIGLALLAFVLQDAVTGGGMFGGKRNEVGSIEGVPVKHEDFQKRVEQMLNWYRYQYQQDQLTGQLTESLRDRTWQSLVREITLNQQAEEIGLGVSTEEFQDMIQGNNPVPLVRQLFTNPQTGVFQRAAVMNFIENFNNKNMEYFRQYWRVDESYFDVFSDWWLQNENNFANERLINKYTNLINKGVYVPRFQAEIRYNEQNITTNIDFICLDYASLPDSTVELTDADYESYYNEHINEFEGKESRDINYVVYKVEPSIEDDKRAYEWAKSIAEEMKTAKTEDIPGLINMSESDTLFVENYYSQGEFPEVIDSILFEMDTTDVYGPYFDENSYKAARITDVKLLPDSAKSRHILLTVNNQQELSTKRKLADSIKNELLQGGNFLSFVNNFSEDQASVADSGSVGWAHRNGTKLVRPFRDTCIFGHLDSFYVIRTQFGYHIIDITEQSPLKKCLQVGVAKKTVTFSDETYRKIYAEAAQFAGANRSLEQFLAASNEKGLQIQQAPNLTKSSTGSLNIPNAKKIIRWAFEAEVNDVSPLFSSNNTIVIAALKEKQEKGTKPLEDIKEEIKNKVLQDKKTELLKDKINTISATSIHDLAEKLGVRVDSASTIRFSSPSMGPVMENNVVGVAASLNQGEISPPVEGYKGVYVIQVKSVNQPPPAENFDEQRSSIKSEIANRASYLSTQAIVEEAKIKDKRLEFYYQLEE
jgi:peptidyl-prolyl cis-trans isomerase D